MSINTTEQIKVFIREVAMIAQATGSRIEVYMDSPIYNTVQFSVEPVSRSSDLDVQEDDGA